MILKSKTWWEEDKGMWQMRPYPNRPKTSKRTRYRGCGWCWRWQNWLAFNAQPSKRMRRTRKLSPFRRRTILA